MLHDIDLIGAMRSEKQPGLREGLKPLLEAFGKYDSLRRRLMESGGNAHDLEQLAALLRDKVTILTGTDERRVSLDDPDNMEVLLREFTRHELRLEYRVGDHGFPVYYFCRFYPGHHALAVTVVEDLYRSPDYPMPDERFARLMSGGHVRAFLRLSQYRPRVALMLDKGEYGQNHSADEVLHTSARHVLHAAWNEDQRVAMLTARHFGLSVFWRAVELLSLILHSDLCELRSASGELCIQFFRDIYPQPTFQALFTKLPQAVGEQLHRLSAEAIELHSQLRLAFRSFLLAEVQREGYPGMIPLYRLVFANIDRLDRISGDPAIGEAVRQEAERLESKSMRVIESILGKL